MDRLQKVIANAGYCSRRKAEELISLGKVSVNGEVVTKLGTLADVNDEIVVEGHRLYKVKYVYYLLNKPRNTVTTTKDDRNRPTARECLKDVNIRVYPVGRLDFDTTGALLFTNDGDLTNKLTHPRYSISKTYIATLDGEAKNLDKLNEKVTLDDGTIATVKEFEVLKKNDKKTIVSITLMEGKNHEVKRIFEAIGEHVIKLNRESFAGISTKGLKEGMYRKLKDEEVKHLKNLTK